jgi:hypothetical protein
MGTGTGGENIEGQEGRFDWGVLLGLLGSHGSGSMVSCEMSVLPAAIWASCVENFLLVMSNTVK